MRLIRILGLIGLSLSSQQVFAQACTPDAQQFGPFTGAVTPAGGLCGFTNQIATACLNALASAPDAIFQVNLGTPSTSVITVTGTGFNPYIALLQGVACNSNLPCPSGFENTGGPGVPVTLPSTSTLPAGTYFIVVTDLTAAVACPSATPFTLTVPPQLPVQLQKFSVE